MIICFALELILPCYTSLPTEPAPLWDQQKPQHELDFPDASERLCPSTELPMAPGEAGTGGKRLECCLVSVKQPSLSSSDPNLHKCQQKEPGSVRAARGRHKTGNPEGQD